MVAGTEVGPLIPFGQVLVKSAAYIGFGAVGGFEEVRRGGCQEGRRLLSGGNRIGVAQVAYQQAPLVECVIAMFYHERMSFSAANIHKKIKKMRKFVA